MKPWSFARFVAFAGGAYAISGCALMGRGEALAPRYYEPAELASPSPRESLPPPSAERPAIRLGSVDAAAYLREKVVYRNSEYELGFFEDRRWTERPESYARRALLRALYYEGRAQHANAGDVPSLDVELIEFEEVMGSKPAGRCAARYVLSDDESVLADNVVRFVEPFEPTANEDERTKRAVEALGTCERKLAKAVAEQAAAAAAKRAPLTEK